MRESTGIDIPDDDDAWQLPDIKSLTPLILSQEAIAEMVNDATSTTQKYIDDALPDLENGESVCYCLETLVSGDRTTRLTDYLYIIAGLVSDPIDCDVPDYVLEDYSISLDDDDVQGLFSVVYSPVNTILSDRGLQVIIGRNDDYSDLEVQVCIDPDHLAWLEENKANGDE